VRKLITVAILGRAFLNKLLPNIVENVLVETQCRFWSQWEVIGTGFVSRERGQILRSSLFIYESTQNAGSHQGGGDSSHNQFDFTSIQKLVLAGNCQKPQYLGSEGGSCLPPALLYLFKLHLVNPTNVLFSTTRFSFF
jgi:hypothetical protein